MVKLTKEQKKEIIDVIRSSGYDRKQISEIRLYLNSYYNSNFDFSSARHWANKAFKKEYLKKLNEDNKIMKKWHNESNIKPEKESVRYAEWLFSLARG